MRKTAPRATREESGGRTLEKTCLSGLGQGRGVSKGIGGGTVRVPREKVVLRKPQVEAAMNAKLQGAACRTPQKFSCASCPQPHSDSLQLLSEVQSTAAPAYPVSLSEVWKQIILLLTCPLMPQDAASVLHPISSRHVGILSSLRITGSGVSTEQ